MTKLDIEADKYMDMLKKIAEEYLDKDTSPPEEGIEDLSGK